MKTAILFAICIGLSACSTPEQNARLSALADLAITYAASRGKITPEDAQAIRDAKVIVLDPAQPVPEISGK